jgi:hypothetical protein
VGRDPGIAILIHAAQNFEEMAYKQAHIAIGVGSQSIVTCPSLAFYLHTVTNVLNISDFPANIYIGYWFGTYGNWWHLDVKI